MFPKEIALDNYDEESRPVGRKEKATAPLAAEDLDFEEIFQRYHSMVFHLALRILGEREEALDVAQDVFCTVYKKIGRFRGDSSLKTWIYRITVNRASNRCRWWNRLRRRGTVSLDEHLHMDEKRSLGDVLEDGGHTPEENLLLREQLEEIGRTLLRLPIAQRIALVMRDMEGMSYQEIAEATNVSLGTVKSRIARGREEMKRRLNGALS